ncbi:hypothetical protein BASA81_005808 [Batrachochytrium salamandrivorans]|nr:hypothetical protein BASA81_005808 [Batrachochytrium salamandrivorans]
MFARLSRTFSSSSSPTSPTSPSPSPSVESKPAHGISFRLGRAVSSPPNSTASTCTGSPRSSSMELNSLLSTGRQYSDLGGKSREEEYDELTECAKLETYLLAKEPCERLIRDLHVRGMPTQAFYVRFLVFYRDYHNTTDAAVKSRKGRKLLEMFADPSSSHYLAGAGELNVTSAKGLAKLKTHVLLELIRLPVVREAIV